MSAARAAILARIRAVDAQSPLPVTRHYNIGSGVSSTQASVNLFCARAADYEAEVRCVAANRIADAIEEVLTGRRARRIGVPRGLPTSWRPRDAVDADLFSPSELDALEGVVTGCTVAIAETGTLVLTCGPAEGPRALTLVPDLHLCVVEARQIVAGVPGAIRVVAGAIRAQRSPVTFISGPSATSDIELNRVEGVHGPRQLVVIVLAPVDCDSPALE